MSKTTSSQSSYITAASPADAQAAPTIKSGSSILFFFQKAKIGKHFSVQSKYTVKLKNIRNVTVRSAKSLYRALAKRGRRRSHTRQSERFPEQAVGREPVKTCNEQSRAPQGVKGSDFDLRGWLGELWFRKVLLWHVSLLHRFILSRPLKFGFKKQSVT